MAADRRKEEMIVDINVFVGALGMLGVATEFNPGEPELSTLESEASSAGKVELAYGAVEAMEMDLTLGEHNASVYSEMAKLNDGEIIAKQAAKQGTKTIKVEWVYRGQITTAKPDAAKRGEKSKNTVSMKPWYFKKTINGKVVCEVDKMNGIVKIDGQTDLLEEARNFVSRG